MLLTKTSLMLFAICLATCLASPALTQEVTVLVAYDSQTGNTEKLAQGVAAGARSIATAQVLLRPIGAVTPEDLQGADAVIVGSPVHMGDVTPAVRGALVNWSTDFGFWESRGLQDKIGAVFATGGAPSNGKEFTMLSLAQTLLQFGMILVSPYGTVGVSATTGASDPGISERELEYAKNLGKRVATLASRFQPAPAP